MANRDITGRIIGSIVFLLGIAILVFVFVLAYGYFTAPGGGIQITQSHGSSAAAANQLGTAATKMFIQLALLVVMAIVGSLIAARGIQFYFGASYHDFPFRRHKSEEEQE